jgi:hypothetical protein
MAKTGPKPRGEFSSKGATLSARITVGTRQRLAEAAAENGRSLSAELEARLARSFGTEGDLRDWGERESYELLRAIAEGMKDAQVLAGKPLLEDAWTFDLTVEVMRGVVEAFRPPGKLVPPETFPDLPYLRDFPEMKRDLRAQFATKPMETIAAPVVAGVIARIQAAAASGSIKFGIFQQISSVLAPQIIQPVLPLPPTNDAFRSPDGREWASEDAYRASLLDIDKGGSRK